MRTVLCSLVFLLACSTYAEKKRPTVLHDIAYLGPTRTEKMDVYLPQNTAIVHPAVLLIHGGGWVTGDKADKRGVSISMDLSDAGFAVFAINYYLDRPGKAASNNGAFPQNISDCKSALRFIRDQAERFHVDPKAIAVVGESAGGQLALLLAETQESSPLNHLGLYRKQSNQVACVVDLYGVADLHDPALDFVRKPFRGETPRQTDRNLAAADPTVNVTQDLPPILIVHGTADRLVPIRQSRSFAELLRQHSDIVDFVEVPDAPHSFDLHPEGTDLRAKITSFLQHCARTGP